MQAGSRPERPHHAKRRFKSREKWRFEAPWALLEAIAVRTMPYGFIASSGGKLIWIWPDEDVDDGELVLAGRDFSTKKQK